MERNKAKPGISVEVAVYKEPLGAIEGHSCNVSDLCTDGLRDQKNFSIAIRGAVLSAEGWEDFENTRIAFKPPGR